MKQSNLPKCVYLKHGAYYLVKNNKWISLGRDYATAMAEYGRKTAPVSTSGSVGSLITQTIDEKEKGLKPNTIKQYRTCQKKIAISFAHFEPHDVKPMHIAQFIQHNAPTPNMANRMLSLLRMSFDRAVLLGLCENNPAISIPRLKEAKRDRLITDQEFNKIHSTGNDALKSIMDLCYITAQRINDVLSIKMMDITNEGITFEQEKTGKKLLIRQNSEMTKAIKRAKALHPSKVTPIYLLGQRNGKKRSYKGVSDLFNRAKIKAGVPDVTLHDIRAKSLTDAKRQGINPTLLAGHTTEAQTVRYLRGKEADQVDGLNKKISRNS